MSIEYDSLQREHVDPLSRGGNNDMSNIVPACRDCNASKHNLFLLEWAMRDPAEFISRVSTLSEIR